MSESVQKPRIRFKGFSDAWEQRKFEDLYNYASEGGTPDTNNSSFYENGDVPFVKIEDTENKYIDSTKSYITQEGLSHSSAWLIPESSVIFTNGATVGNVAINRLPVATKQGILGIIPSKNVLTEFLFYLLSSATFQREVRSRMATGTFATIILKNLNQIPVCIPSDKSEQEEIAGYLSAFDNLITLHQRKYDKLVAVKKALLEKMFPADGETVPKIRFKGFSDAWEQRKAKELCNIGTGKSNTQDQVEDGTYPFYIRSDIPVKSNKYLYDCEAVITIGDGNIGRVFHYVNGKFDLHQRCYKMTDFQDIWGKYFYYFFSTRFYDRAMKMTAKATVDSVRLEMISEMDILKPMQITEQRKIAEFFTNLDNLITLHQRQLEKLKNIKSALLEKMFV